MRVLQLPVNVASHMAITVRALRATGIDARGMVVFGAAAIRADDGLDTLSRSASRRDPQWVLDTVRTLPRLAGAIRWADVLHWYMAPGLPAALDLRYAALLGKPMIVEFAGSEIRNPDVESLDNPWYAARGPKYEYARMEDPSRSRRIQEIFANAGCEALISCPMLEDYLVPGLFRTVHAVRQRVEVSSFEPHYPDPSVIRPTVVHLSTARVAKGTDAVVAAVEQIRRRDISFEFKLVEGTARATALEAVRRADVVLDQFVLGAHGSAAVEAMALGKPVLGYLKASALRRYPADIPIVVATKETLADSLAELLANGERRAALGRASRQYALKYHDAAALAPQIQRVYAHAIESRASRSREALSKGRP